MAEQYRREQGFRWAENPPEKRFWCCGEATKEMVQVDVRRRHRSRTGMLAGQHDAIATLDSQAAAAAGRHIHNATQTGDTRREGLAWQIVVRAARGTDGCAPERRAFRNGLRGWITDAAADAYVGGRVSENDSRLCPATLGDGGLEKLCHLQKPAFDRLCTDGVPTGDLWGEFGLHRYPP